jgi:hypothetical protein
MMPPQEPGVFIAAERCARLSRQLGVLVRLLQQQNGGLRVGEDFGQLLNEIEDAAAVAARGVTPSRHLLAILDETRWVTVAEAAPLAGISERSVQRLAKSGRLIARHHGQRSWLIDAGSARNYGRG